MLPANNDELNNDRLLLAALAYRNNNKSMVTSV